MNTNELKAIGERISKRRRQLGLTQEQVAEKMDVSIQMISNLERGNKAIRIENLIKICDILSVSTDYVLLGVHNKNDVDAAASKLTRLSDTDYKMIELIIEYCNSKTEN